MVRPRQEPTTVPISPRCLWRLGYQQASGIPYGHCQVNPYYAPKAHMNANGVGSAQSAYNSNNVFVGNAPGRGVYTGVKYG